MMHEAALLDALLLGYATGELSAQQSLLVATLLSMRDDLRRRVAAFEGIGGRVLEEQNPAHVCSACLEGVLARIDGLPLAASASVPPDAPPAAWQDIPAPLRDVLQQGCAEADIGRWQKLARGVDSRKVFPAPRGFFGHTPWHLSLMRLAPHTAVPAHRHSGAEIMLVLEGGYHDGFAAFRAGDISIIEDPAVTHQPVADGEGCTCLVLTKGHLQFVHRATRFFAVFFIR